NCLRHLGRAAKAMHDTRSSDTLVRMSVASTRRILARGTWNADRSVRPPTKLSFQYLNRLVIRRAAVNDDREAQFSRNDDLPAENLTLHIARAVIVIVVKPDLAPRDHLVRILRKFDQMSFGLVVVQFRVVRMNTDRGPHILITLCNRNRPPKIIRMRITRPNIQHRRHARVPRSFNDLIPVLVKLRPVNMEVRVDQHTRRNTI